MPFRGLILFLGYRKGEDGKPEIDPEEAKTVRLIYSMFMDGKTVTAIARELTKQGVLTPTGRPTWRDTTVESILTNEKYKGDAILQKSFTVDFLSKKTKKNEGEVPQYYVEDSHPAIIDRDEWELVQAEMSRRKAKGRHQNSLSPFSSKVYCGECGSYYGSKIWHSNDKYRRVIWRCNGKYERQTGCATPHLLEEDFKRLFLKALSRLQEKRELLIADCEAFITELAYTDDIDRKTERIREEQAAIEGLVANLIQENATVKMNQTVFNSRLEEYTTRFDSLGEKLKKLEEKKNRLKQQTDIISQFIQDLKTLEEIPVDFSPSLWNAFVEKLTIYPDGRAEFLFKNGAIVTETI